jgi:hypothetical protein
VSCKPSRNIQNGCLNENGSKEGEISYGRKKEILFDRRGAVLVNEVANLGEDSITQFNAQQPGRCEGSQVFFESVEYRGRQICLFMKHSYNRHAVGVVLVVAGKPTRGSDHYCDRKSPWGFPKQAR